MKKIFDKLKRPSFNHTPSIIVVFVLALVSAIPLIYSWGRFNIGFDTFLPFIPENSYNLTYQWTDRSNGIYTLNLYFVWVFFLHTMQRIGFDIYRAASMLQFFIFFMSGLGIYRIFNLFHKNGPYVGLIPAIFYIYSPFMLDFMLYQVGIVGIVWSIYFILKFVVRQKLSFLDAVFTAISLATIIDLPNPKYHFIIFVSFALILFLGIFIKLISWTDVRKNLGYFIGVIALSAYLLVPFAIFGYSFAHFSDIQIATKKDYALTGETIDYGVALVYKMIRLFHTPNLTPAGQKIIETPFIFFAHYLVPILILGIFPFILLKQSNRQKKLYLLLYIVAIFFIFLSKGANPPFGMLYEIILFPQVLSFLRTTAGFVVYAGIFYAIIFGLIYLFALIRSKSKLATSVAFFIFILLCGTHIWTGQMFLNHSEKFFDTSQYGIKIPKDYFEVAKVIENRPLDAKVDIYPAMEGYTLNSWGYFGIVYYPWLFRQPTITFEKESNDGKIKSAVNTGYLLHDKTADTYETANFTLPNFPKLYSSRILDLYEVPEKYFIPHIYIPDYTEITDKIPKSFLSKTADRVSLPAYFSLSNHISMLLSMPDKFEIKPLLEYTKINPTKYRVRIQGASSKFPLVFLENYHILWKLYLNPNPDFANELKTSKFISANMHGTIQNENLPQGNFFETIFYRELNSNHLKVNKFFNSWIIDPKFLCAKNNNCKLNSNGSYDFELVIEFWPQIIANLSLFLSISTIMIYGSWKLLGIILKKMTFKA